MTTTTTSLAGAPIGVSKVIRNGGGLAKVLLARARTVELDWEQRQQRDFEATTHDGVEVHASLPAGAALREGDILVAADGSLIRVVAALQPVTRVAFDALEPTERGTAMAMAAYQLGRLGISVQCSGDHLIMARHPLVEAFVDGQGWRMSADLAKFEPVQAPTLPSFVPVQPRGLLTGRVLVGQSAGQARS